MTLLPLRRTLWAEAHLRQQGRNLPAGLGVGGGQLQVIALLRVRDAAPGQKGPPHKGSAAALVLQQAEIHVQHQAGVIAQQVHDPGQLVALGDAEDQLVPGASGRLSNFREKARWNSRGSRAANSGFSVMMRTSAAVKVLQNSSTP